MTIYSAKIKNPTSNLVELWFCFFFFVFSTSLVATAAIAEDRCSENKFIENFFIDQLNSIKDKNVLTSEDSKDVTRPLISSFDIDFGYCEGFTDKVIRVAEQVILNRKDDLKDLLAEQCNQPIPNTNDLLLIGAIIDQKRSAKKAMELADFPESLCMNVDP